MPYKDPARQKAYNQAWRANHRPQINACERAAWAKRQLSMTTATLTRNERMQIFCAALNGVLASGKMIEGDEHHSWATLYYPEGEEKIQLLEEDGVSVSYTALELAVAITETAIKYRPVVQLITTENSPEN